MSKKNCCSQKKYIFVTGGVVSSLGKGLASASIAMILEQQHLNVAMLKLDPYLNIDPGTINPFEHGEVYVTDDGAETDLDLGHYYRFTQSPLSQSSNATSGQIYHTVINKERKGAYLGQTVQVIPHITNEIKNRIHACANQNPNIDIVIVEIGGTVGDIESQPFLEAIRQFRLEHSESCVNIHMTYLPCLKAAGELKTKPTQHSVNQLQSVGILPDLILCRSEYPLTQAIKNKIALFCNVRQQSVIEQPDVKNSIYELPLDMITYQLDRQLYQLLDIKNPKTPNFTKWKSMIHTLTQAKQTVSIGLVGKYIEHQDAYKSVIESLYHAGVVHGVKIDIQTFNAEEMSLDQLKNHSSCDGYLVPGGFGLRGIEGKMAVATYCRTNNIPYFGICLGMQIMVIEYARSILNLQSAHSTEIDPHTPDPIISLLSEQTDVVDIGGTMRLGLYSCALNPNSIAYQAYQQSTIYERHRHRYEFNNKYLNQCESNGLLITGKHEGTLCEIVECANHPWMLGVQFHPEFQSKPLNPHPLFVGFIGALLNG